MTEVLTQQVFDAQLASGELALALIGMSNVGKSHWSRKLEAEAGFSHVCCDDLIETELGDVITGLGYRGGIADMAKWMGQPYDPQFAINQMTYLQLESDAMSEVATKLRAKNRSSNTVIDTTGSLVHIGEQVREGLACQAIVVYLEATPDMKQEMFELYMKEPKPVVWENTFSQDAGETCLNALARCYPNLLAQRSGLYEQMADVTISRDVSLGIASANDFLGHIRQGLPVERTF